MMLIESKTNSLTLKNILNLNIQEKKKAQPALWFFPVFTAKELRLISWHVNAWSSTSLEQ